MKRYTIAAVMLLVNLGVTLRGAEHRDQLNHSPSEKRWLRPAAALVARDTVGG
jgi:hypothetical protein